MPVAFPSLVVWTRTVSRYRQVSREVGWGAQNCPHLRTHVLVKWKVLWKQTSGVGNKCFLPTTDPGIGAGWGDHWVFHTSGSTLWMLSLPSCHSYPAAFRASFSLICGNTPYLFGSSPGLCPAPSSLSEFFVLWPPTSPPPRHTAHVN